MTDLERFTDQRERAREAKEVKSPFPISSVSRSTKPDSDLESSVLAACPLDLISLQKSISHLSQVINSQSGAIVIESD